MEGCPCCAGKNRGKAVALIERGSSLGERAICTYGRHDGRYAARHNQRNRYNLHPTVQHVAGKLAVKRRHLPIYLRWVDTLLVAHAPNDGSIPECDHAVGDCLDDSIVR